LLVFRRPLYRYFSLLFFIFQKAAAQIVQAQKAPRERTLMPSLHFIDFRRALMLMRIAISHADAPRFIISSFMRVFDYSFFFIIDA